MMKNILLNKRYIANDVVNDMQNDGIKWLRINDNSSSVPAHVEMMGLIGAGNNPMVGMTVAVAVSVEEAAKAGKF